MKLRWFRTLDSSIILLIGTALVTSWIHWAALVEPFALHREVATQRSLGDSPALLGQTVGAFVLLGALYWSAQSLTRSLRGAAAWSITMVAALACATVHLFSYPVDAADIFDNIMHGRILAVYGANPFHAVVADFPADPFYRYAAWKQTPSAYGPLWELAAAGAARLAGDGFIANVLAFKLLGLLCWAAAVGLTAGLLRALAPEQALRGVLLLAWNPVILWEVIGNAHNDIAMILWVVAAAWALGRGRGVLAVAALVMGALVKFMPLLLIPAAVAVTLSRQRSWRARVRFLALAGALSAALIALLYLPFWEGFGVLRLGNRADYLTTSLPAALYYGLLLPNFGAARSLSMVGVGTAALTCAFALIQMWPAWRSGEWKGFVAAALRIFLFYLLVTCLWFQPWYVVWVLALAPLIPEANVARLAFVLGFAAPAKTLIWVPLLAPLPLPPKAWREVRLGPATLLVPWLYALYLAARDWMQSQTEARARSASASGDAVKGESQSVSRPVI